MSNSDSDSHTRKTRSLKKYEADIGHALDSADNPDMQVFSPFGPMIAKFELPGELVESLNHFVDQMKLPEHSCEFRILEQAARAGAPNLISVTADAIKRYLDFVEDGSNNEATGIDFELFWGVYQRSGTPSPVHFHSGDISGVLYLRTPADNIDEERKNYISGRQAGFINFLIGGKQRYSKSLASFKPVVGDLYIFPGWLLHGAEPFKGDGERLSIAFNANIADQG